VLFAGAVALRGRAATPLGKVEVYERGHMVAVRPLVAARSIERPGPLARAGFYAKRTLEHVWGWVS
jgi:hypothetical protein